MSIPFNHRYRDFLKNVCEKSKQDRNIATYFDLQYKENEKMSITMEKHPDNHIIVTLKFSVKTPIENIPYVPLELVQKIYSYVSYEYIHLSFKITFPEGYPFVPPKWTLMEENNNVSHSALQNITIRDYFLRLTTVHNEQYKRDEECVFNEYDKNVLATMSDSQRKRVIDHYYWSPAITIEKDVLYFVTRINHFDHILQTDIPFEEFASIETRKKKTYLPKASWKFIIQA